MDMAKVEVPTTEHPSTLGNAEKRPSTQDNAETKSNLESPPSDFIGGFEVEMEDLPPGYFTSRFFLGTFMAIGLGLLAGVGAFVSNSRPASTSCRGRRTGMCSQFD